MYQVTGFKRIFSAKSPLLILFLTGACFIGGLIGYSGYNQREILLISLLVICFVLLVLNFPEPAIFATLLLSTDNLKFLALHELPGLQLGVGLFFNLRDLVLILLFISSLHKLKKKSYIPLFTGPIIAIFAIALLNLGISVLTDVTGLSGGHGLNLLRNFFSYSFFFCLITHMDSKVKVKRIICFFILICVVALGVQVAEGLSGERFTIQTSTMAEDRYYGIGSYVRIENEEVLYNWNRAVPFTFFVMFLCYGASLFSSSYFLLILPFLMFIGMAWGFSRIWYVMTAVGLLMMMILNFRSEYLRKLVIRTGLVIFLIAIFMSITVPTTRSSGGDLSDLVWNRFVTVLKPTQEENFIGRAFLIQEIWKDFKQNPLIGLGFDPKNLNVDLGAMTTLSLLGLPGLVAVCWLILCMLKWTWRLQNITTLPLMRGASQGIMASIFGIIAGYALSWDFFTRPEGIFLITFICYLVERGVFFYKNGSRSEYIPSQKNY